VAGTNRLTPAASALWAWGLSTIYPCLSLLVRGRTRAEKLIALTSLWSRDGVLTANCGSRVA
jgi:hypothetical protein